MRRKGGQFRLAAEAWFFWAILASMFEVLAFVYENYNAEDGCPEAAHLQRKLNAVGFEEDEISEALDWLAGLGIAARFARPSATDAPTVLPSTWLHRPSPGSVRIYSIPEQNHLGPVCLGYLSFMESAGILPAHIREVVMDRAMAVTGEPVTLDDLKIIILMVFWTFGQQPDTLALDELCEVASERVVH
jgi:Smg protein